MRWKDMVMQDMNERKQDVCLVSDIILWNNRTPQLGHWDEEEDGDGLTSQSNLTGLEVFVADPCFYKQIACHMLASPFTH